MKEELDSDIQKLEQQLAELSPSPLTENLLSRMEEAMVSWERHLPVEEKIVQFEQPTTKKSQFPIWSSAAAVAIMGAVAATFMTPSESINTAQPQSFAAATSGQPTEITPSTSPKQFSHQLTNASNEGITYAGDDKPYKVFRIEYIKDVKYTDDKGNIVTKKEPAVDVILVPIEMN